jgi:hypothetical protein
MVSETTKELLETYYPAYFNFTKSKDVKISENDPLIGGYFIE